MTEYPHVPAAFINAISEEGSKAEAVEFLQKQWNENCALRKALRDIRDFPYVGTDALSQVRLIAGEAITP